MACGYSDVPFLLRIKNKPTDADAFRLSAAFSRIVPAMNAQTCTDPYRAASRTTPDKHAEHLALHALLDSDVTVMVTTASGVIQYVNSAFERRSGYSAAEALGRTPDLLKTESHGPDFLSRIDGVARNGDFLRTVLSSRSKNGEVYHEDQTIAPVRNAESAISHYVFMGRPLAALPVWRELASHSPERDALTGVASRQPFIDRLHHALDRARLEGHGLALLHVDIDRFRTINDTLGHHVGDQVLTAVAARIAVLVGKDAAMARLGGDEFALVVSAPPDAKSVEALAKDLLHVCAQPLLVGGRTLYAGVSVGIASYPEDADGVNALLRHAEIAMYRAKAAGRGRSVRFSKEMEKRMLEDLAIENALRSALANDEFEVYYQPIVTPGDGRTVALEALLRWHSAEHGEVPPARFVPMLEDSGQIAAVGRWVLKTACRQFMSRQKRGDAPTTLAVNLSGQQFRDSALIGDVQAVLAESGLAPQQLELEITENILIEDASAAARTLHALAALGVRLAIDDFGTGYSSLSYLRRFPINTLKIDRSFVAEIETSQDALVITRAIVNLAHNLGIGIVAEGVENAAQLALLSELGCARVQGFLFGRPQPMAAIGTPSAGAAPRLDEQ